MKTLSILFILITYSVAQTNIPPGNVSGTWTSAGSPYYINGNITVPNGETLLIEPQVKVIFKGHYKFLVQGRLLAMGTIQDSIYFTAEDHQNGWHSIRFVNTPNTNDTSKFFYCSFKYGNANTGSGLDRSGGAMMISYFNKVLVSSCLFDSNKQSGEGLDPIEASGGVYIYYASAKITNSTFSNNISSKNSAVGCIYSPNSIISNNVFYENTGRYGAIAFALNSGGMLSGNLIYNNFATEAAGGILVDVGSTPIVSNNIIVHNQGLSGGITCYLSVKPVLISNTIAFNTASYGGGGIGCRNDADPILINNILYGNSAPFGKEIALDDNASDPVVLYSNIRGGKEGIEGAGGGLNYTGLYEHNIDVDPLFFNASLGNYRLSDNSLCIGAGIDSVEVAGIWYHAPVLCFEGNPRPDPAGSMPDIGACENRLDSALVDVEQEITNPMEFTLSQNYPNPFNPSTKINWQSPVGSHQTIKVFDVLGNDIVTLVNEYKSVGRYEIEFDAAALPSGVYFYQLKAGDYTNTKKMVLLK